MNDYYSNEIEHENLHLVAEAFYLNNISRDILDDITHQLSEVNKNSPKNIQSLLIMLVINFFFGCRNEGIIETHAIPKNVDSFCKNLKEVLKGALD